MVIFDAFITSDAATKLLSVKGDEQEAKNNNGLKLAIFREMFYVYAFIYSVRINYFCD